ncbi:outer membrane beta-barrel protein [Sphingomonas piscis]|uniref:Outer membrane beta-barrel protein n=1 Tax=Sphingomonas piscis TaxID=2714943 RepID=A0A6G7YN40_9SPHN|nr:outer membrane beta-barrel protein [Sphingomonas piscis]QIK78147.1 outer membrane beta-barrel protein [Sphingomonas piscis]
MKKFLLAAAATAALAAPAAARDGSPYVGIEGGLLLPRDVNGDAFVDNVRTVGAGADFSDGGAFEHNLKRGWDVDVIGGYDFGAFRLEGELGWKRAKREGLNPDGSFLGSLNTGLNRPSVAPDPGAPGLAAFTADDFDDVDGKVSVRSAMVNALVDFGADDGLSFYGGVGAGRAWAKALNDSDSAWAFQGILGLRTAVSENIDLGLKYRYFRTGRMGFVGGPITLAGNPDSVFGGTYSNITPTLNDRFRSHSLLASLTFNFGAPVEPAPVVAAPPPPPAAPATQTCPDGSVVLATDVCPAPPPPPPPAPAPAGERG